MSSDSDITNDGVKFHRVVLFEYYTRLMDNFDLSEALANFRLTREYEWTQLNSIEVDQGTVGSNRMLLIVAWLTDIQYTDYILRFK
jgi:hypothetical protein